MRNKVQEQADGQLSLMQAASEKATACDKGHPADLFVRKAGASLGRMNLMAVQVCIARGGIVSTWNNTRVANRRDAVACTHFLCLT
jgi:hypothetical protein